MELSPVWVLAALNIVTVTCFMIGEYNYLILLLKHCLIFHQTYFGNFKESRWSTDYASNYLVFFKDMIPPSINYYLKTTKIHIF